MTKLKRAWNWFLDFLFPMRISVRAMKEANDSLLEAIRVLEQWKSDESQDYHS